MRAVDVHPQKSLKDQTRKHLSHDHKLDIIHHC